MLLCFQCFSPSYQSTTTLNANGRLLLMQRVRQFVWSSSFHRGRHIGIHLASSLYTPKTLWDSLSVPSAQMLITAGAGTSERRLLFSMQMDAAPLDGTAVLRRKSLPVQPEWNRKAFCFHLIAADQLNMTYSWWVTSSHYTSTPPVSVLVIGWVYEALSFPDNCWWQIRGLSICLEPHNVAKAINY